MSVSFTIDAQLRDDMGKGASRRLRRAEKVPAILYGAGKKPVAIMLNHHQIQKQLENEAVYSHILTLNVEGKEEKAILRDLQRHPYKQLILHADFQRVKAGEKIHVHVPLHFIGEDVCVGVKQGGGVISHVAVEVEVSCLPKDLPEFIEVDLSGLNVGEAVHLSDLKLPGGVTLVELSHGSDHDAVVAAVHSVRGGASDEEKPAIEGEEEG